MTDGTVQIPQDGRGGEQRSNMKAHDRSFEENYRDLVQISDTGADIFGSELGRDILRESCPESAVALCVSILKMQLEQEWFFCKKKDGDMEYAVGSPGFSHMLHRTVCECMDRRLERYRSAARRGALLGLIDGLEGLGQERKEPETERDRALAARLPESELIALAAYEAQRHAGGLWAEYAQRDKQEAEEPEKPVLRQGCHATAAALALAAYAEYSDLRCAPELLADISAAAAEIAYAEPQEAFAATGYMALLTASAALVDLAEASLCADREGEAGMEAELSWESAEAFFGPFIGLFSAGLRLAMGAGAAGLLAEAASAVRDFAPEAGRSLTAPETGLRQTEAAGETESMSEEAPEKEGEFT